MSIHGDDLDDRLVYMAGCLGPIEQASMAYLAGTTPWPAFLGRNQGNPTHRANMCILNTPETGEHREHLNKLVEPMVDKCMVSVHDLGIWNTANHFTTMVLSQPYDRPMIDHSHHSESWPMSWGPRDPKVWASAQAQQRPGIFWITSVASGCGVQLSHR